MDQESFTGIWDYSIYFDTNILSITTTIRRNRYVKLGGTYVG